jgi:hypothetical protein
MFEGVPNYPTPAASGRWSTSTGRDLLHRPHRPARPDARGRRPVKKERPASPCACWAAVGEPINPEAWLWYHRVVGEERLPIVDTWWQTETGGILISPLPGATALKPGSATKPLPGVKPQLVDAEGKVLEGADRGQSGHHRQLARPDAHASMATTNASSRPISRLSRQVLHRRRLPPRRRRLLLDHRPGRRRHQRLGPPPGHRRDRERPGRPRDRRRGRRGRLSARHQGPGHLRLCHPQGRRRPRPTTCARPDPVGPPRDRPHRRARRHPVGPRPAQDPLRQDHAPHPAQDRRERTGQPGRHLDPGRSGPSTLADPGGGGGSGEPRWCGAPFSTATAPPA